MTKQYTRAGYAFCAGNNRGHDLIADFKVAASREKYKRIGVTRERFEDCVHDIKGWLQFLKRRGYQKIALQGHSLGCSKVVYFAASQPNPVVKAVVLASPSDMVGLSRAGAELKRFQRDMAIARRMVRAGKGNELLPHLLWNWYYLSAKTYINFNTEGGAVDVFSFINYRGRHPAFRGLKDVAIPIFAFFGGGRGEVIYLEKERALQIIRANALRCPKFDYAIIDRASHSYFGHEAIVASKVVAWLESVL